VKHKRDAASLTAASSPHDLSPLRTAGFFVLSLPRFGIGARRADVLQYGHRKTLFGQAPFDEPQFSRAQLSFEQVLIPINIPLMAAQAGDCSLVHSKRPSKKCFLVCKELKINSCDKQSCLWISSPEGLAYPDTALKRCLIRS
jgi:hypothetical protein